jgi:hypothetical protein
MSGPRYTQTPLHPDADADERYTFYDTPFGVLVLVGKDVILPENSMLRRVNRKGEAWSG